MRPLKPPVDTFTSQGGRTFTVAPGEHIERWPGDSLWCDTWPILYEGQPAGKLYRDLRYGKGAGGLPRWHASTRELFWSKASAAPIGIGFDVAAFDTALEGLSSWGRSADQILDWSEGKQVQSIYNKVGNPCSH